MSLSYPTRPDGHGPGPPAGSTVGRSPAGWTRRGPGPSGQVVRLADSDVAVLVRTDGHAGVAPLASAGGHPATAGDLGLRRLRGGQVGGCVGPVRGTCGGRRAGGLRRHRPTRDAPSRGGRRSRVASRGQGRGAGQAGAWTCLGGRTASDRLRRRRPARGSRDASAPEHRPDPVPVVARRRRPAEADPCARGGARPTPTRPRRSKLCCRRRRSWTCASRQRHCRWPGRWRGCATSHRSTSRRARHLGSSLPGRAQASSCSPVRVRSALPPWVSGSPGAGGERAVGQASSTLQQLGFIARAGRTGSESALAVGQLAAMHELMTERGAELLVVSGHLSVPGPGPGAGGTTASQDHGRASAGRRAGRWRSTSEPASAGATPGSPRTISSVPVRNIRLPSWLLLWPSSTGSTPPPLTTPSST